MRSVIAVPVLGLLGLLGGAVSAPPAALALQDIDRYAFVIGQRSNEVVALDTWDDAVAARFALAGQPRQIFVLEDAGLLVAATGDSGSVELVDLRRRRLLDPIAVGHAAEAMQYHPDSDLLAVADAGTGAVALIDLGGRSVRARLSGLERPTGMIFAADGERLFVSHGDGNAISVVDTASGAVSERLDLTAAWGDDGARRANGVASLARTPNGWLGFAVPNAPDLPIVMFDLSKPRVLNLLPRGAGPSRGFNTADGAFLIVPNNGDATISLFSMRTRSEVARLPATRDMAGVSTGWFDTSAFVSSPDGNRVLVLDLINWRLAGAIEVPGRPGIGATTPDGLKLYVPLTDVDKVAVIDTRERALVGLIEGVGAGPRGIQIASPLAYCH